MRFLGVGLAAVLAVGGVARAGEEVVAGNWKLNFFEDGQQMTFWLLRLEGKDGKLTGNAEALRRLPPTRVDDVKINGDMLQFGLKITNGPTFMFEGRLPKPGAKKIFGTLSRSGSMIPAFLEATTAKNSFELDRELVTRTPSDPRAFGAVLSLIKQAKKEKIPAKDVQEWTDVILKGASLYGPAWQQDQTMKMVAALGGDFPEVSIELAKKAEADLEPKSPAETRLQILSALAGAYRKLGKADEAKAVDAKMDALETQAHAEHAKAKDFALQKFAGRKGKSNRAVLVELFTGAQCPPCVAADMGFEGLEKTFKPQDVVLLQYHLHIPGPDALTNQDAVDRQSYYGKIVRGTPSLLFNGKEGAPGGGGKEDAEDKYKEYFDEVLPLLEKPAGAEIKLAASRKGDKIDIKADVSGVEKPGEKIKLRFALVEDWVRYKGRNGLAFHTRVVRAMPGGAAGISVDKKDLSHAVTVDLAEVRKNLTKYLDDFERTEDAFPDAQRPMRLQNLSVVAYVQDDATREVLQAADVPVKE